MPLVRRLRIPAVFCALAVLVCELVSRPYANMGICDDGPYILMARNLASTGHIVYNGWSAAMIVAQLYFAAAFIKLFGYSMTAVRMSTLLIALLTAFLLQRTLVRAGITGRNATIGTLALVLSPLYLMLSVSFMTDIFGLFAIVLCLYGCLRALQSSSDRSAIAWLCFAVVTNALFGTSRQIAWLGVLVMVPSALWLLRSQRRVVLAGGAATLAGAAFILACVAWLKHQPYGIPVPLFVSNFPLVHALEQLGLLLLDAPFLLLPIMVLFFPEIRKLRPRAVLIVGAISLVYLRFTLHRAYLPLLEPTEAGWVTVDGIFQYPMLQGWPPIFLHKTERALLTIVTFGGLLGLIASLSRARQTSPAANSTTGVSPKQLIVLVAPFTVVYALLLLSACATTHTLYDRYDLGLMVVALPCLVRYYQDRIHPQLSLATIVAVAIMAVYGIAVNHNTFALARARVALAAEIRASGVPDTSVDNGWEYNFNVELEHSDHINDARIVVPANAYVPIAPPSLPANCQMWWYDETPHIHPVYGTAFDPDACYGTAPFAPVHYSRWLASGPGTLYVVRFTRDAKP